MSVSYFSRSVKLCEDNVHGLLKKWSQHYGGQNNNLHSKNMNSRIETDKKYKIKLK